MSNATQEEIIAIKIAKNVEAKNGKIMSIGSTSKRMGGLDGEKFEKMRKFGIEVAKQVGIEESTDIVKDTFNDEEFQEELGIESQFCNEYWYVRREYDISKYFEMKKDMMEDILEIMLEGLKEGIEDNFKKGKIHKVEEDTEIKDLKEYILNFKDLKKELGL